MNTPVRPSDIAAQDAPAAIGHNRQPAYDPDIYAEKVRRVDEFAAAGGEWLDLEEIQTDAEAQHLADFIAGARKLAKDVEAWRVEAKKPHDDAGKLVQKAASVPAATLDRVIKKALELLTPYQIKKKAEEEAAAARQREEARKAAEEAERLAAQARARNDIAGEVAAEALAQEAAEAEKAANKRAVTGGAVQSASGGGRTVALVETRSAEITAPMQVFMFFRDAPEVLDVLQRLANAHVRAKGWDGKDIPGTTTIVEQKAR